MLKWSANEKANILSCALAPAYPTRLTHSTSFDFNAVLKSERKVRHSATIFIILEVHCRENSFRKLQTTILFLSIAIKNEKGIKLLKAELLSQIHISLLVSSFIRIPSGLVKIAFYLKAFKVAYETFLPTLIRWPNRNCNGFFCVPNKKRLNRFLWKQLLF